MRTISQTRFFPTDKKHCETCVCDEKNERLRSRRNVARIKCAYCDETASFLLRGKARCYTHRMKP